MTDTVTDRPIEALLPIAVEFIRNGFKVYFKWTCPKCGERCAAVEPNKFCREGFIHETRLDGSACGQLYPGPLWGLLAIAGDQGVWP